VVSRLPLCLACLVWIGTAGVEEARAQAASAPNWPTRPIKLIVPTGAGSATDIMARLVSEGISRGLGQSVVVENMAGASGIVAHQAAARAPSDGYTLLFTNTSGVAINLVTFRQLPYDPTRDFTAVAMVVSLAPQMVSVNSDLPVKTLPELIGYAQGNRGKLSVGADATAGAAIFTARLLNKRADLGLAEVPYRAAAQMGQDTASGVNPMMVSSIAVANPFVQAGKIRRIAVSSGRRFPGLDDLPTMAETVPGVVVNGWFGMLAPAGTPADIVGRINQEVGEYLKGRDIRERLLTFGLATEGAGTPESTAQYIRDEQARWRQLAAELNIQPQ
jgi:tripartite-type tricarboxylate transporter receptor subunit TctC